MSVCSNRCWIGQFISLPSLSEAKDSNPGKVLKTVSGEAFPGKLLVALCRPGVSESRGRHVFPPMGPISAEALVVFAPSLPSFCYKLGFHIGTCAHMDAHMLLNGVSLASASGSYLSSGYAGRSRHV